MNGTEDDILQRLYALQDPSYQAFQAKLIPNLPPEKIIGVRTGELRALARELTRRGEDAAFLARLPHRYFEEDQLHAFLISDVRIYGEAIALLDAFLPHVDNWATCDQMSPKIFSRHRGELIGEIDRWLASDHVYTVRFAIGLLLRWYLDDMFLPEYPERVAAVPHGEYYIDMMRAWYFATALARQYDAALPYLVQRRLDVWTHNKTIQKAIESYRIPPERKAYLRTLRIGRDEKKERAQ